MSKLNLRFALLARVSTEAQEIRGESLRTQERQIEAAVRQIGGHIVKKYMGSEHATPDFERKMFDQLLVDAQNGKFDAVCVSDSTRWSRDGARSREGIDILRKCGVRFYTGTTPFDLHDPQALMMLGMLTITAEYTVKQNIKKSAESRIDRARRGFPTAGVLPWGRECDNAKDHGSGNAIWRVKDSAKKEAERMYELYSEGKSLEEIGTVFGHAGSVIRRRFLAAGPDWTQSFKYKGEIVAVKNIIPGLLSREQVEEVKARAKRNTIIKKTGNIYPLAHLIRCGACGSVFSGHYVVSKWKTGSKATPHYRHHYKTKHDEKCTNYIPCALIEKEIFSRLGLLLRDSSALQKAVSDAVLGEQRSLSSILDRKKDYANALARVKREQKNLVAVLAKTGPGGVSTAIRAQIEDLDLRQYELETAFAKVEQEQKESEIPGDLPKRLRHTMRHLLSQNGYGVFQWPDEDKLELAQFFFGSHVRTKPDLGIFVQIHKDDQHGVYWTFKAKGRLIGLEGVVSDWLDLHDKFDDWGDGGPFEDNFGDKIPSGKKGGKSAKSTNASKRTYRPMSGSMSHEIVHQPQSPGSARSRTPQQIPRAAIWPAMSSNSHARHAGSITNP